MTQAKHQETDWSKYDNVCFAILGHSSECGWIELWRGKDDSAEAWRVYEAQDWQEKMLLNFGSIIHETTKGN